MSNSKGNDNAPVVGRVEVERSGTLPHSPDSNISTQESNGSGLISRRSRRDSLLGRLQVRGSAFADAIGTVGQEMMMELQPSVVPVQQVPVKSDIKDEVSATLSAEYRLNSIVDSYPVMEGAKSSKWVCEDGIKRSGNTWTATGHILTAVLGSGVLALPYAMASLGWIVGSICFVLFAWITLFTAQLLADLYIVDGIRQRTFPQMVRTTMGVPGMIVLGVIQQFNLVLTALAYTVTAAQSMVDIANLACNGKEGCFQSQWAMGCIFGGVQLLFSQAPNLESFWWASAFGALMSLGYSLIALGLGIGYHGTEGGIAPKSFSTTAQQVWNILNSIGAILFAYSFSIILLEIQDTLSSEKGRPTGPITRMKRAVNVSVAVMTGFYISVACSGFASQGYDQEPYILKQFEGIAPNWVLYMANAMVILHLIAAYQVWSQPHFALVEEWVEHGVCKDVKNPSIRYITRGLPLRILYRSLYVVLVTFLAILLPFFESILGFVGAIGFWPMTVFFPINCWIRVFRPKRVFRIFLHMLDAFCFLLTLAVVVASVQSMIQNGKDATLFS